MAETSRGPRRHWRYYTTLAGAQPVRAFLAGLTAPEHDELRAELRRVARDGLRAARHLRGELYEVRAVAAGQQL